MHKNKSDQGAREFHVKTIKAVIKANEDDSNK